MAGHQNSINANLPESLKRSMEKFQAKNSLPVFLKGGAMDRGLFGITVVLCGVGIAGMLQMVYTLAKKK
ncbi:unnamed protein product [Diamesa serratosioi]